MNYLLNDNKDIVIIKINYQNIKKSLIPFVARCLAKLQKFRIFKLHPFQFCINAIILVQKQKLGLKSKYCY